MDKLIAAFLLVLMGVAFLVEHMKHETRIAQLEQCLERLHIDMQRVPASGGALAAMITCKPLKGFTSDEDR